MEVSKRLAIETGVVSLPAEFFLPNNDSYGDEEKKRWIRFSVANVDDIKVRSVCERLGEVQETYGWKLD
jgi:aspartate/methionine/tyrosine aminotransferase